MTTKNTIALAELAEKGADADLLRDMIQFVAQRMLEMDVESLCVTFYGERCPDRVNSRDGYRERLWETRRVGGSEDPEAAQGWSRPSAWAGSAVRR